MKEKIRFTICSSKRERERDKKCNFWLINGIIYYITIITFMESFIICDTSDSKGITAIKLNVFIKGPLYVKGMGL